jgi:hypothetical protein
MADGPRFNVDDPRFKGQREYAPAQPASWLPDAPVKRRSWLATCFVGCLISLVVLLAVVALGVWWVSQNWRDWASSLGSEALKEGINATELPPEEKDEIGIQIDRLADELREGRLSGQQMQSILEQVMDSPLMTTIVASAIESKYIADSGLTDDEKNEGRQTIRRFMRGAIDNKIKEPGIDAAMKHVAQRDGTNDPWELRDSVTDEQLRAFFTEARSQADQAEIPPEAEDIDPSDEFKRIIDDAIEAP